MWDSDSLPFIANGLVRSRLPTMRYQIAWLSQLSQLSLRNKCPHCHRRCYNLQCKQIGVSLRVVGSLVTSENWTPNTPNYFLPLANTFHSDQYRPRSNTCLDQMHGCGIYMYLSVWTKVSSPTNSKTSPQPNYPHDDHWIVDPHLSRMFGE